MHEIPDGPALTPAERRGLFPTSRSSPMARCYPARPGTGPEGETCGSCRHRVVVRLASNYHKCDLMRDYWTGGGATDIRVRSPSCSKWEAKDGR